MTLQKIEIIGNTLGAIDGLNVSHYWRFSNEYPYCIWQEIGEIGLQTDGHKAEQGFYGQIEFFTRSEYDTYFDEIQNALNTIEKLYWEYDGASFENETNLIHHSWTWRLL